MPVFGKDHAQENAMNPFDAVVTATALVAVVMGFSSGLLRSLATILAYLIAAPLAVAFAPYLMAALGKSGVTPGQAWIAIIVMFVVFGILFGVLLRAVISEFTGPDAGLFDRIAGAVLGAVRIVLIAVLIVVIFDRVIPAGRQPQFLANSRLRPYLSAAGQKGLQSLPPEIDDYIGQLRRQRGI
jgi:membrane protein required for colicin V production